MSDEGFIERWSRRKRKAAAKARTAAAPESAEQRLAPGAPASPAAAMEPLPLVDPATLPPIETIEAASDIRPFLAPGVPADLVRSALRRAWSADPTIRDFIGLSENSWDFNAPDGIPGFGALTVEDARRFLARALGEPEQGETRPAVPPSRDAARTEAKDPERPDPPVEAPVGEERDIAMQHDSPSEDRPVPPRRHGTALPQ